jgi:hypothetical protein
MNGFLYSDMWKPVPEGKEERAISKDFLVRQHPFY